MTNVAKFPKRKLGTGTWQDDLVLTEKGTPKAVLRNALIALRRCPEWDGRIAFDEFSSKIMLLNNPPWEMPQPLGEYEAREWRGVDDIRLAEWLQVQGIYL